MLASPPSPSIVDLYVPHNFPLSSFFHHASCLAIKPATSLHDAHQTLFPQYVFKEDMHLVVLARNEMVYVMRHKKGNR